MIILLPHRHVTHQKGMFWPGVMMTGRFISASIGTCSQPNAVSYSQHLALSLTPTKQLSHVNHSCRRIASNRTLPKGALHVMNIERTTGGINKAGDAARRTDKSAPPMWCSESFRRRSPAISNSWLYLPVYLVRPKLSNI